MRRFWPQSLFGRNVVVLAGTTALSVILSFVSVYVLLLNAQMNRMTSIGADLVNTISAAALELEPDARDALLLELDDSEFLQVKPPGVVPEIGDYRENAVEIAVMQRIIDRLDYQNEMDWRIGENRTIWLNLRIGDEFYWVAAESSTRWTPIRWLVLVICMITLVVIAIGVLATRQIAKPLAALKQETDRLSLGSDWQLTEIEGPAEITALAKSFERMTSRLKDAESIRAETLAELSHDLRTPLARLRLAVEMMKDGDELKSSAVRQVEQIDSLIEQFMDYARNGRTAGAGAAAFNLSELVVGIADEFGVEADIQANIQVSGQAELVRRAVMNLVENALKYGALPVHLSLGQTTSHAVIEVTDRGRGFGPDEASDMLEPFKRGTHDVHVAGAGLGLAIAARVAAQHQGSLSFEQLSPTGFTATFTISI